MTREDRLEETKEKARAIPARYRFPETLQEAEAAGFGYRCGSTTLQPGP